MPDTPLNAITLQGMTFHIPIGVLPHEREHPQPIELDLTAWTKPGLPALDYRELYAHVRAAAHGPQLSWLEELAESIAASVLDNHAVERVRVAVRKPHAAVGGPLRFAEVAIVRRRHA